MRLIDADNAWGIGILQDWYIHSVNPDDIPQWTDEHIEELCEDFYVIPKETTKYDIDYDLNRLKELAEADKEGRCLVLPCKEGKKVYKINFNSFEDYPPEIYESVFHITDYYDVGNTVFLTEEEAEKALEGLE